LEKNKAMENKYKKDFPIFSEKENEGLVYLDSAATTQKPKYVLAKIKESDEKDTIRGYEGIVAKTYFDCFDELILQQKSDFSFNERSKRPPEDNVNSMLSLLYTLLAHDVGSALSAVGIDSYVGFMHTDRPGRMSMALDMMEELRGFMERQLVNVRQTTKIYRKIF